MSNPGIPFDASLLKKCELGYFEIFALADQCDKESKCTLTLRKEISRLVLLLNTIELTSINSTDDKKTIENLVDMAQMYSEKTLRPIIANKKRIKSYKLGENFYKGKLSPSSVCVPSIHVKYAMNRINANQKMVIKSNGLNIVSVAGGFPMGKVAINSQISEVEHAISHGAKEIDLVIDRGLTINGDFKSLFLNIKAIKDMCKKKNIKLKIILSVMELEAFTIVYKAAMTAMMAGSDFISTSTGTESEYASLSYGVVICQAIRDYYGVTGHQIGFKANGGIVQSEQALEWFMLITNMLGPRWLNPKHFRIGGFRGLFENIIKKLSAALIKLP